jgi:acyl carrier protein
MPQWLPANHLPPSHRHLPPLSARKGTNAHVLLVAPAGAGAGAAAPAPPLHWRRRRHWFMAPVSPLLAVADASAAAARVVFAAPLGARGTAALLQLGGGSGAVAAGALLLLAAAAVDALAGAASAVGSVLLSNVCLSPQAVSALGAGAPVALEVAVDGGRVVVSNVSAACGAQPLLTAAAGQLASDHDTAATLRSNRAHALVQALLAAAAPPAGGSVRPAALQHAGFAHATLAAPGASAPQLEPAVAAACRLQACLDLPVALGGARGALVPSSIGACVVHPRGSAGDAGPAPFLDGVALGAEGGWWLRTAAETGAGGAKQQPQLIGVVAYRPAADALLARPLEAAAPAGAGEPHAPGAEVEQEEGFTYTTVWETEAPSGDGDGGPAGGNVPLQLLVLPGRGTAPAALRALAALQAAGATAAPRLGLHAATLGALAGADAGPGGAASVLAAAVPGAAAWAALRAAALEQRDWDLSAADADAAAPGAAPHGLTVSLQTHNVGASARPAADAASLYGAALRGGTRLAARLARAPVVAPAGRPAAGNGGPLAGLNPEGTYVVTGGGGFIGAHVARWLLARAGARHVHLVSRSGRVPAELADLLPPAPAGSGAGARPPGLLTASRGDVACASDAACAAAAAGTGAGALPVLGVMHAAGVLDDGLLGSLAARSVQRVDAPKAAGLRALMARLRGAPLEATALFSSVAALLGSPGQAAYAAANAAIDAAAAALSGSGVPAVSVQWGAWAGAGMAASDPQTAARAARLGVGMLQPAQALAALEAAVAACRPPAGAGAPAACRPVVAAVPIRWPAFLARLPRQPPAPFFAAFAPHQGVAAGAAPTARSPPRAGGASDAAARARRAVDSAIEAVLGAPVPDDAPLMAAGLDSLGAVELHGLLGEALGGVRLPATLIFDAPTPAALAAAIGAQLLGGGGGAEGGEREAGEAGGAGGSAPAARPPRALTAPQLSPGAAAGPLAVAAVAGRTAAGAAAPEVAPLGAGAADPVGLVPLDRWDVEAIPSSVLAARWAGRRSLGDPRRQSAGYNRLVHAFKHLSPASPLSHTPPRHPPRFGAFLPEVDAFDAAAFGVSAPEAALMDPQQRLLLEAAAEVLLSAGGGLAGAGGAAPGAAAGAALGAYVGIASSDYGSVVKQHLPRPGGFHATANAPSVAAGRLAFVFALPGPAVAVDTACSASLVALHLARGALLEGVLEGGSSVLAGALVAGVHVQAAPTSSAYVWAAGAARLQGLGPQCAPRPSSPSPASHQTLRLPLAPLPQVCCRPQAAAACSTRALTATCAVRPSRCCWWRPGSSPAWPRPAAAPAPRSRSCSAAPSTRTDAAAG